MLLSGFFLKKKPPFNALETPHVLENRSRRDYGGRAASPTSKRF
jgi:hypothetical protein